MPFNFDRYQLISVKTKEKKKKCVTWNLKNVHCVKDLGGQIESNLKFLQQFIDPADEKNK